VSDEDPTTPKAKRTGPVPDPDLGLIDEDTDSTESSLDPLEFSFSTQISLSSQPLFRKMNELLKEAPSIASGLANAPDTSACWYQTTIYLTERLFININYRETQQARHNEAPESVIKLAAEVEAPKAQGPDLPDKTRLTHHR